jgi:predicted nucleic acid-binding protein
VRNFLVDTNIVSEIHKGDRCDPKVRAWFHRTNDAQLFLSVLLFGELRRGIENRRLKDVEAARALERRRNELEMIYKNQILPVTAEIADLWGRLCLKSLMPPIDGLLAATALHHRLTLVTRNTRDVSRSGVACFNPFVA